MTRWIEAWVEETLDPPYVLIVRGTSESIRVIDPAEKYRVVYESKGYEDVRLWLLEYERVDGRKFLYD